MTHPATFTHPVDPPHHNATNSPWAVPGIVDRLTELWGYQTSTAIAVKLNREFGTRLTRASVTGKLDRLGLLNRGGVRRNPEEQKARARERAEAYNASRRSTHANRTKPSQLRITPSAPIAPTWFEPVGITLLELTQDTCRWPLGDLPYTFCGEQPLAGLPYCPFHSALAYKPREERRRA